MKNKKIQVVEKFKRFFIQEDKNEPSIKIKDALDKFHNKNHYWFEAGIIFSLSMIASRIIFEDRDIMYISLYMTALIVFIEYNGFVEYKGVFQQIIDTLGSLWDRKIISGYNADILEINYCKFIDDFNYWLNNPLKWFGAFLSIICIWFLLYEVKFNSWVDVYNYFIDSKNNVIHVFTILHVISDLFISIAFGFILYQLFVISVYTSKFGNGKMQQNDTAFDLTPQLGYHDGCGGLSSIGDLSLRIVVIISIIGIFLAGLIFIIGNYPEEICTQEKYKMNCEDYGPLLPFYLIVPIALALISFFWPLLKVHKHLVVKWIEVQKDLDQLGCSINQLEHDMITRADKLELDKLEETAKKLSIMRQTYDQNSHYSTWPFNIGILQRLALYQTMQLSVLIWNFIPSIKVFLSHIIQLLEHY